MPVWRAEFDRAAARDLRKLGIDAGYAQQPARIDSELNSLALPGASPFGRR